MLAEHLHKYEDEAKRDIADQLRFRISKRPDSYWNTTGMQFVLETIARKHWMIEIWPEFEAVENPEKTEDGIWFRTARDLLVVVRESADDLVLEEPNLTTLNALGATCVTIDNLMFMVKFTREKIPA